MEREGRNRVERYVFDSIYDTGIVVVWSTEPENARQRFIMLMSILKSLPTNYINSYNMVIDDNI